MKSISMNLAVGLVLVSLMLAVAAPLGRLEAADEVETLRLTKRLPPHYSKIVTAEQREEIYAIQGQYVERIEQLRAQLNALIEERDARVKEVLTPEQAQALEELQAAEAKARRVKARASEAAATAAATSGPVAGKRD